MVNSRQGWYWVDAKTHEDDRRIKDKKEAALEAGRASMVKRCDNKIARRRAQAEQREVALAEELSRVQAAVEAKQEEIEVTHRLAAELSRRRNEEVKRALKSDRIKSSAQSPSSCALNEARWRLIEEKVRLEASQAELLRLWHEEKIIEESQLDKDERRKRNLRDELQNQLADNRRRVQQKRSEEKELDRKMTERAVQKIQEEDAKTRKRKGNNAILLREEMAASFAAKKAWERKYKEALKDEDERIARIIAEKEARQEKQIGTKMELRAMRETAIDNVARELLANVCKERKKQEIADELYREEQRSKWTKESIKPASKKRCDITFEKIARQKAERKARDEAIDAAFTRYSAEERKKYIEKQRQDDNARQTKKIQYRKELKEVITNNRVNYAMDILKRQSEICAHDEYANRLTARNVKQSNDRNDDNIKKVSCKKEDN
ncbi:PREDICTED: meiosis-specific nuclear structural protein 1-like [Wasmannia auropunctata]|uniref:meiosis-specific nuclear structural protein 1-like n=1 Tax=Wasmannia auropunctata TaxID=64793 RepID=UPI0005EFD932|nr:PREDICTED: meiosis-specific nuclear structural protein 1-like [Wasmannia auropunctata]